jgi:hypothetical protein
MPRTVSRLMVVVALLAFLSATSHALPHAPAAPSDCSDCDHDHSEPSCPCPGGCALCCVAKVPCPPVAVALADVAPRLDDGLDEAASAYDPPFFGTPTRPPRS